MRHTPSRRTPHAAIGLAVLALLACAPGAAAATSAASDGAETTITGSPGSEQITITLVPNPDPATNQEDPAFLRVQDPSGVSTGTACTAESPTSALCQVQAGAIASAGAGNDTIVFSNAAGVEPLSFVRLFGLEGNDTLSGSSGTDFVYGGTGNDRIDAGAGADYIECGDGADAVANDPDDLEVNDCESFITVGGGGGGAGGGGAGGIASAATIRGGRAGGTVKVSSKGTFTLRRQVVECPTGGASCKVGTSVTRRVKKKRVKLGGSSYTLAAGKKGALRLKLTKQGLRTLKRAKRIKGSVSISVRKGSTVTRKTVSVTLRAPKR